MLNVENGPKQPPTKVEDVEYLNGITQGIVTTTEGSIRKPRDPDTEDAHIDSKTISDLVQKMIDKNNYGSDVSPSEKDKR